MMPGVAALLNLNKNIRSFVCIYGTKILHTKGESESCGQL